ncbi:MAG: VanZ family protein [Planctomycetia bacterium]|jgi:VanZ family protein
MTPTFPVAATRLLVARLLTAATATYVLVLVFATHYPKPERFLPGTATADKLLHFLAYGLLATLVGAAVAAAGGWTLRRVPLIAVGLLVFAALDEITQPFFPPRTAEPLDWVSDAIGIGIGLACIAVVVAVVRRLRGPAPQRQLGVGAR